MTENTRARSADSWVPRTDQELSRRVALELVFCFALLTYYAFSLAEFAYTHLGESGAKPPLVILLPLGAMLVVAGVGVLRFSRGAIEIGLFPNGMIILAIAAAVIVATARLIYQPMLLCAMLAAFAGVGFGVAITPLVQWLAQLQSGEHELAGAARTTGAAAAGLAIGWTWQAIVARFLDVGPGGQLLLAIPFLLAAAWLGIQSAPDYFVRITVTILTRTVYRLRLVGLENVPKDGPALLISNHLSYADGNLIVATFPRIVRFIVYDAHYNLPFVHWMGRVTSAIPIDATGPPRQIIHALQKAADALKQGELVFVFAEGGISRLGFLQPFHRGFELIMKRAPGVPIIPLYIDGMWGSIFSYQGGKFFWKWPKHLFDRVTIKFGRPMPSNSTTLQVREQIQILSAECLDLRKDQYDPLPVMLAKSAKRFSRRPCIADGTTPMLTFGQTLMRTIIFARLLRRRIGPAAYVGIFLPPSVATALTNFALSAISRIPVNLNYTVGEEVLNSCIEQCEIKQVITSRRFLDKIKLKPNAELIILEELRNEVEKADKLIGFIGRFLPAWLTTRLIFDVGRVRMDDLATVIFSSGSTGIPKGIMLTHHNVVSNIDSVTQQVDATHEDRVMGVLPLFHSFGYTVAMWLPIRIGASTTYHFSPLEAEAIGNMVREQQSTILLSTATFLRHYIRKCGDDDFKSLRILMCGAEKLPMAVADQFENKFGVRPLEGYGCTELSPAVAANRPDIERRGTRQVGNKPGTIGHTMPGMAVRIVHPETNEPLPIGQEGMLLVKGPNVMKGYLKRPDLTAEVIRDGWYRTGDIAKLDEDGFLTITDRMSRFSKIGGEMVPHAKIENEINRILGTQEQVCAVVGVPDERKGERLAVLHTSLPITVEQLWRQLQESGLPPLWVPARNAFFEVSELPVLGSGKLDLKGIKSLAHTKMAG